MAAYRKLAITLWVLFCSYATGLNDEGNEKNIFENYTVYSLVPQSPRQVKHLGYLSDVSSDFSVLKGSRGVNDSHDILVPPEHQDSVEAYVQAQNITYTVKRKNYGEIVAQSFQNGSMREARRRDGDSFKLFDYNSYSSMVDYIKGLATKYPNLVKLEVIGKSYEGRPMFLVKISTAPEEKNPIILIDAGIHAREWVAPSMATYILSRLTRPEALEKELRGVDWYIVPMVNPDGYEFTRSSLGNRLWRKTRSRHGFCFGVDGNRNYDFHFGVSGVSFDPCDKETYAGPKAFSEVETSNIGATMKKYAKDVKLYISLHAYGQYLVYPWGFTGAYRPKCWKKLDKLARSVSDAIVKAGGQPFKVLSAGKWYAAAGGSDDYAFGAMGIPYSYTMELTDGHDFIFPSGLLKSTLPQLYAGIQEFGRNIKNEFQRRIKKNKESPTETKENK